MSRKTKQNFLDTILRHVKFIYNNLYNSNVQWPLLYPFLFTNVHNAHILNLSDKVTCSVGLAQASVPGGSSSISSSASDLQGDLYA